MSETISDNWNPFRNDEESFLVHVKSLFRSWDTWLFSHVEKPLDNKKVMVNFKIYDVTDCIKNNYNRHIKNFINK